jgi:ubiquinone/menaquinone biosynthesis C-methylase UbiE
MAEDPIVARLKPLNGGRILDVATSHGDFLKLMTDSFARYTEAIGIDVAESRIIEARKNHEGTGLEFVQMDAERIKFEDGRFDTVGMRHSLHHLTHPGTVLAAVRRVLKPGGRLVFGETFVDPATERPDSQRHLHHFWADVDLEFGIPHYHALGREEILEIVRQAGWEIEEAFDYFEDHDAAHIDESLEAMLKYTGELVDKLVPTHRRPDLVERGRELMSRFSLGGSYTDESMVYFLGRNPG